MPDCHWTQSRTLWSVRWIQLTLWRRTNARNASFYDCLSVAIWHLFVTKFSCISSHPLELVTTVYKTFIFIYLLLYLFVFLRLLSVLQVPTAFPVDPQFTFTNQSQGKPFPLENRSNMGEVQVMAQFVINQSQKDRETQSSNARQKHAKLTSLTNI